MKHKHAELIKAWADGAVIEQRFTDRNFNYNNWESVENPIWHDCGCEYRIKPEPKPDVVRYVACDVRHVRYEVTQSKYDVDNLKLTFDGDTGKLKSAEVIQ